MSASHLELPEFAGKLALVTGAGDGIGAMIARGLAQCGMTVCVQDVREEAAGKVAGDIGGDAFAMAFDVGDRDACFAAAASLSQRGPPLNLLWINAGVGVGSSVMTGRQNAVEWAYSVNVLGAIWTAQAFRPLMEHATGARHIGVTASSASLRDPGGELPLYAATKHATLAVGEALRGEAAIDGIGVTILCPGLLSTNIWDGARARPDRYGGPRSNDPSIATRWREAKPASLMWPHIARTVSAGGGYLVCATDGNETQRALEARTAALRAAMVEI